MIIALMAAPVILAADTAASGVSEWVTIIATLVVGLGGGGGIFSLLKVRTDKRNLAAGTNKIKAEAADILADSAVALLGPLRDELIRANAKVDELAKKIVSMEVALARERITSDTRIRQLEEDIANRDRQIIELTEQGGQ